MVLVSLSLVLLGLALAASLWFSGRYSVGHLRLQTALEKLEQGEWEEAKRIAVLLKGAALLPYEEWGGPPYVLGRVILANPRAPDRTRQEMCLLASRYLHEAYDRGFPTGHQLRGLRAYARSLVLAGRYDESVPIWRELLSCESRFDDPTSSANEKVEASDDRSAYGETPELETSLHLADALLHCNQFDAELAEARIDRYLAGPALSRSAKFQGRLVKVRILLRAGDLQAAAEVLEQLPADAARSWEANIERVRLQLALGEDQASEAAAGHYRKALALARAAGAASESTQTPGAGSAPVAVLYLTAVCHLRLKELDQARPRFAEIRRQHPGTEESFAAAFQAGELSLAESEARQALLAYEQMARESSAWEHRHNRWLSRAEARRKIQDRRLALCEAERCEQALKLSEAVTALFSDVEKLTMQAEVLEAWGDELLRQAKALPEPEQDAQTEQARAKYRQAGRLLEQLAEVRFATTHYTNDLWACGEDYLRGQAFEAAARVLREYLDREANDRRPLALLRLARCCLTLGKSEEALEAGQAFLALFSKHPLVSQTRIVTSRALFERGEMAEAKAVLRNNLYGDSQDGGTEFPAAALTPNSPQWRDSLYLLGEINYQQGVALEAQSRLQASFADDHGDRTDLLERSETAFHDARNALKEALVRFPDAPQSVMARYLIAQAFRRSANRPQAQLLDARDDASRQVIGRIVDQRLAASHDAYTELLDQLLRKEADQGLTPLESRVLRNCYFGRADAKFERGDYADAIKAYRLILQRYSQEPEAIEAHVRIASGLWCLDEPVLAREQLQLARTLLQGLPLETDFKKTTRYGRSDDWSRMLTWMMTFQPAAGGSETPKDPGLSADKRETSRHGG